MAPQRLLLMVGAVLGALYAAGLFYEIDLSPPGCCGLSWPTPDPGAAERWVDAADPKGVNAAAQRQAALEVMAARPAEPSAWLRLAYADRLQHGQLTDLGARAVDTSYLVSPYAGHLATWRTGFALDNWSRLTQQGRQDAIHEINIARTRPNLWLDMHVMAARARQDPSGRMAAALLGLR
jgi:hypothetical protein